MNKHAPFALFFFVSALPLSATENLTSDVKWSLSASPNLNRYDTLLGLFHGGRLGLGYHLDGGWALLLNYEFTKYPEFFRYAATMGVNYSFSPQDIKNSFYAQIDAGMEANHVYVPDYRRVEREFVFNARFGKHFRITDHLSYSPEISVRGGINGEQGLHLGNLIITPIQFTFFF